MHKVLIRPLEVADSKISWNWRNDPEVWKYTGSRPDKSITQEIEHDWIIRVLNENSSRRFAIITDDKYVGNIQLTDITNDSAEYHIFIGDKDYWGKGIASLATNQILYFAKVELNLSSVFLSVRKSNSKAISTYKRNSFIEVGGDEEWIKMKCDLAALPPPSVSVFVMVYNHEKYLSECLDGILMQKCNFNFNIVVGEDCSTDRSREILLNYKTKFPGKFKLLLHEKNIGAMANQNAVLNACNGKYIALCEGDDYWIDPYKLQKQCDFLENNEEYFAAFHIVKTVDEINSNRNNLFIENDITSLHEAYNSFVPTCSLFFRNKNILKLFQPSLNPKIIGGDKLLLIGLASQGKIKSINSEMAVYRINSGGVSITLSNEKKIIGSIYTNKFLLSKPEFKEIWSTARKSLLVLYGNLAVLNYANRKFLKYLKYMFISVFQIRKVNEIKILISDFIFMRAKQ